MLFEPDMRIVNAYTEPFQEGQWDDANILILDHARVKAEDRDSAHVVPLGVALRTEWPDDTHLVQYAPAAKRRLKKEDRGEPLAFPIAAFDLDFKIHHEDRQTGEDFNRLLRILHVIDHTPNLIYPTWGGARIVYRVSPMTSGEAFEARYTTLVAKLAGWFTNADSGYAVDVITKDWTRLFRLPRVVREHKKTKEPTPTFNTFIRVFHERTLNLLTFEPKERPKQAPRGEPAPLACEEYDGKLHRMIAQIDQGQRNRFLFASARHIIETYDPAAAELLLDRLAATTRERGLEDREIERTIQSARTYRGNQ